MARPQRIYHVQRGGNRLQVPRNENEDDEEAEMPESEEGESDRKDENYDEEGDSSESPDDDEEDVDDNDYDDEEDSLVVTTNTGRKRRSGRAVARRPARARRNVRSASYKEVDEDEEFELENDEPPPKDKSASSNKSRNGRRNQRFRQNALSKREVQQDDDDDDSSEEDVKPKATPRHRTFKDIEDDEEASYNEADESEDENYESEASEVARRPQAAKRKRGRPKKQLDSSDEEEEYASEEEQEEKPVRTPQRKRGRPAKKPGRPKKSVVDDDGSDDDDEDFGWTPPSRKLTRVSASRSTRRSSRIASSLPPTSQDSEEEGDDGDDSNDDELEDDDLVFPASNSRRTTPPRTSATIASRNISSAAKSKEAELSDEDEEPNRSPSPKKRKAHMSSDEEFLEDDSDVDGVHETDSDDIAGDEDFDDDEESLDQPRSASRPSYNVDTEQVGTMDDSSSSEDENKKRSTPRRKRQDSGAFSRSELTPRPHRPKGMDDSSASDSSDSDRDTARASGNTGSLARPRLPECSSTEDAITGEALPKRHVCYFSPDGSSKQCFALETLRQIALTSSQRNVRTDLIGDNQQIAFLQPPHFRTVMSAFYVDQIASRFGRGALDIHGEYYNRKPSELRREGGNLGSSSSDEEDAFNDVGNYHYSQSFYDDLQRYIDRQMGSQDVYACPLCYSEMHTRVDNPSREDESTGGDDGENEDSSQFVESKYDPMLVLGYLDNDQFQAASSFCFTKVANIKKHLRDDHQVETKGIQGNDLYARFKVRAPDGLLQRYLKKTFQYGTTRQGDMRRYWNEGNNYNFVHLLYMIQKANRHRNRLIGGQDEIASDHDNEETAEDYFAAAQDFFDSFQNRARRLWARLSSPFRTSKGDDLRDFLAADDDYEEEDGQDALAHRQVDSLRQDPQEDSNDFISKIQRKYAEDNNAEYDDVDEDDEEDGDSELEIVGKPAATIDEDNEETEINGYYSVEEEATDPWEVSIKQKMNRKKMSKEVSPSETPRKRKKISRKGRNGSLSVSAQKRGTHALEDSDSDFEA